MSLLQSFSPTHLYSHTLHLVATTHRSHTHMLRTINSLPCDHLVSLSPLAHFCVRQTGDPSASLCWPWSCPLNSNTDPTVPFFVNKSRHCSALLSSSWTVPLLTWHSFPMTFNSTLNTSFNSLPSAFGDLIVFFLLRTSTNDLLLQVSNPWSSPSFSAFVSLVIFGWPVEIFSLSLLFLDANSLNGEILPSHNFDVGNRFFCLCVSCLLPKVNPAFGATFFSSFSLFDTLIHPFTCLSHTHTHTHTHYFSLAFLWFDCIEVSISLTNKFPFLTRSRKPPLVLQMTLHHKWQLLFVYRSLFHLEEIIKKQTVIRLRRRTGTFTNINTVASLSSSCSYSGCCSTSRYYRPEHTPNTRSWWQQ